VNREICGLLGEKGQHDLTVFYCVLDTATGELEYTCCSHQPSILIRRDGKVEELTTEDMYIGVIAQLQFKSGKTKMAKGERLVLYTDGIVEAMNAKLEQYDTKRLLAVTKESLKEKPAVYVKKVIDDVDEFCSHAKTHDDRAILCVDFKG
jgi:sigma-B regulation protein RsbU (phosphoserine phosphatase)